MIIIIYITGLYCRHTREGLTVIMIIYNYNRFASGNQVSVGVPKPYFLWYLGIVTGILLTGLHSLDRCTQSRFAQRQANSESAALLYLSVQACGEVAWTKYHSYGRDNKSTVTELLASFFVLYHQVLERWSRERSTGLRYDPPHMSNQGGQGGVWKGSAGQG